MDDISITKTIAEYKTKACDMVNGHCEKCEACYIRHRKSIENCYIVSDDQYCCFDTVNRFIEQVQNLPVESNTICSKEDDHVWRWIGSSMGNTLFRCQKCSAIKAIPESIEYNYNEGE